MRVGGGYFLDKRGLFTKEPGLGVIKLSWVTSSYQVIMEDKLHPITPNCVMKATYFKMLSKLGLEVKTNFGLRNIYYSAIDNKLKVLDDRLKKYYFNIELDDGVEELSERTAFKMIVPE